MSAGTYGSAARAGAVVSGNGEGCCVEPAAGAAVDASKLNGISVPATSAAATVLTRAANGTDLEWDAPAVGIALSTNTPQPIGTASAGTGAAASKDGHIHGHGDQLGGTLHAAAGGGTAGFMTDAQATTLAAVQGQLDAKAPIASPAFTGTATAPVLAATTRVESPTIGTSSAAQHALPAGTADILTADSTATITGKSIDAGQLTGTISLGVLPWTVTNGQIVTGGSIQVQYGGMAQCVTSGTLFGAPVNYGKKFSSIPSSFTWTPSTSVNTASSTPLFLSSSVSGCFPYWQNNASNSLSYSTGVLTVS